jgi:isopropylmalate/homocitrate/citramalate synthase
MAEPTYIRDVSLRDGLQMVQSEVPTATKLEWLNGLVAAGLRRVEVTSFVPPAVIPQFADAPEVGRLDGRHQDLDGAGFDDKQIQIGAPGAKDRLTILVRSWGRERLEQREVFRSKTGKSDRVG